MQNDNIQIRNSIFNQEEKRKIYSSQVTLENSNQNSNQNSNPEFNMAEIQEWKNDIEFSLEKISERVVNLDFSNYLNLIETKINDLEEEFDLIKKKAKEVNDLTDTVNKNNDKCEKSEILCDEMINQINEFKLDNIKWQKDMTKSNTELTDKILSHEFYIDQLQKFEKSISKKLEIFTNDLKRIENNFKEDNVFIERLIKVEEV
jgi:hypothetical protein